MSVMSAEVARQHRYPAGPFALTPWARAAIGPTDGWVMPPGYQITGGCGKKPLPVRLRLFAPGKGLIATREAMTNQSAPMTFGELVELAWADAGVPS